jgi:predicted transcriptional regulator
MINRDLELRVRDSLKIALTVTERFLSLGLFAVDGTYDYSADLMSSHPQALEWGKRLFEYYHASSERVKFAAVL